MRADSTHNHLIPDVLEPGLITVICGRAPRPESARRRAYYAHFSNKFWEILFEAGLTDRRLDPEEFHLLPGYGIGLTDINKTEFGSDHELSGSGDNPRALHDKIEKCQPRFLAFNGKNNFRLYCHEIHQSSKSTVVNYGRQDGVFIESTEVWVLPNTSARARGYWDSSYWHQLASCHRQQMDQSA